MLDAYTVKKAIPRVLIAVIAINLSIYLCVAALDITTIIGRGLNSLLVTPFIQQDSFAGVNIQDPGNSVLGILATGSVLASLIYGVVATVASGGAVVLSILGFILPVIITIALISLAVLFTLVIRQGLLIFLTVISPIAIVCYVLPGTEKYFKQWWDLFLRTLMVYPIIAAIFAMCNVMSAILLNSATGAASMIPGNQAYFAQQSDAIGTIQIIAAILVLYLPLVLIPFSFKLAGGAISAVMNAASGRAASLSGRAGQAIQKSRQDPNSWLGSRAAAAKQNRLNRNVTPGQIFSGAGAGIRARARGRSFRSAYGSTAGAIREAGVYDQATAYMENNAAFKAISGNDDSLWAFRNGNSEAEVRRILQERNPGIPQRDIDETTAMVMRAKSQTGQRVGQIAAVRAQAKTGTGYEDNAEMLTDIVNASGGDMNTTGRMLAEMRGSAVQAGQVHLGKAGFNDQMVAAAELRSAISSGSEDQYNQAVDNTNHNVMRSVIDSSTGQEALWGKPSSATSYARAHREKVEDLLSSLSTGRATTINGQQRVATSRDVKQAMAVAHGIHDSMRSAPAQNQRAFADEFMGAGINVGNLSPEARAALGPAALNQGVGESSLGPDGNLTFRQAMQELQGYDQEYDEMRHDLAARGRPSSAAEAAELERARQTGTGGPGDTPGTTPPSTPASPI